MGLDISFYSVKRNEVGYFRKVNFIMTYFDITDDENEVDVEITQEKFAEFVADLKCELLQFDSRKSQYPDSVEIQPINPKFYTRKVIFGGSTLYDEFYWGDMQSAYDWSNQLLKDFDWDGHKLVLNCWW